MQSCNQDVMNNNKLDIFSFIFQNHRNKITKNFLKNEKYFQLINLSNSIKLFQQNHENVFFQFTLIKNARFFFFYSNQNYDVLNMLEFKHNTLNLKNISFHLFISIKTKN